MLSPRGLFGLVLEAKVTKFWPRPRPQTFGLGLGLKHLASAWPRSRCQSGIFQAKIVYVKFGNLVNFSGNNLKSYVVNHYLVLFHNYFWPRPWPQSPEIGLGLDLGLGLEVLASFNITDWQPIGSYIWGLHWCQNEWLWPLFRSRLRSYQPLRHIRHWISRKPLEQRHGSKRPPIGISGNGLWWVE